MKEISTETLAALYPLESRRVIKNYASFIEDNPDWMELGNSLLDYKNSKALPDFTVCSAPDDKNMQKGQA
ncbi:hypothetical protein [Maridesulfovibrio zosterae]|uniref:hypothetical protein n=1 Tax=Maridesulfovibrio zosterae TaxID=82171 RepID=UPI0003F91EFB|nr:hypothetical protein [Maridesulfovibrio zosterae]